MKPDRPTEFKNAVRELRQRLVERRDLAGRLDNIEGMSELQLREEKAELKHEWLKFKKIHGRPVGEDRQEIIDLRRRNHDLKRRLTKSDNRYV